MWSLLRQTESVDWDPHSQWTDADDDAQSGFSLYLHVVAGFFFFPGCRADRGLIASLEKQRDIAIANFALLVGL